MTRLFEFRHALLCRARVAQQLVEVGTYGQTGRVGYVGDQATGIVLPAVLGNAAGIPDLEQGSQRARKIRSLRHLGAFD